jgi:hypothetical protein
MTNNNTLKERVDKFRTGAQEAVDTDEYIAEELPKLIQQAKEEEMNRIEDKFIKYVNWNWHASLGYGEDLKIFEKALEEYSWLELDKESILNKLSNTK